MWEYDRSTNQWAWLSGTSSHQYNFFYDAAVPGTLGVPAVGNVPAGRTEAMTWKDKNGDFCLFGGDTGAIGGYLNDLWKYSPATSQWEWVSGTTSVPSCPQGNCGLSGVYGTLRTPAAANNPGARSGAVTWTDSQGNLWLFGGYGYDSTSTLGYLNDLWRFSPSTNQWAWMGGSSSYTPNWTRYPGQSGVYGVMGEPDAANVPGGRSGSTVGSITLQPLAIRRSRLRFDRLLGRSQRPLEVQSFHQPVDMGRREQLDTYRHHPRPMRYRRLVRRVAGIGRWQHAGRTRASRGLD